MPSFSPCSSRQVNVGRGTPLKACNMRAPVGGSITGGWAMGGYGLTVGLDNTQASARDESKAAGQLPGRCRRSSWVRRTSNGGGSRHSYKRSVLLLTARPAWTQG